MKYNACIYLASLFPIFNKAETPIFESFDPEHSSLLYSTLMMNNIENIKHVNGVSKLVYCMDEIDKEHLPELLKNDDKIVFTYNTSSLHKYFQKLSDKHFNSCNSNLIIFSRSMGITKDLLEKALDQLTIEDEAVVIGKTSENYISFIGFNNFNNELFNEIDWETIDYDSLLAKACRHENFIHVLSGNILLIKNLNDFKKLYSELSKKESLSYCNHEMHEQFTNIFIEYKDLLK